MATSKILAPADGDCCLKNTKISLPPDFDPNFLLFYQSENNAKINFTYFTSNNTNCKVYEHIVYFNESKNITS
jgi:hypothetical protein